MRLSQILEQVHPESSRQLTIFPAKTAMFRIALTVQFSHIKHPIFIFPT